MKKLLAILVALVSLSGPSWAADDDRGFPKFEPVKCPKSFFTKECFSCHVMSDGKFTLKETAPDAHLVYPIPGMRIIDNTGYYLLTDIDARQVDAFFQYLKRKDIKKAVIDIHSPGGALFDGQRIVSLMREWQKNGGTVETRVYSMAFSAGFLVFTAGDKRLVDPFAELMWHEIQSFSGFGMTVSTPSDKEDAARIMRHLQDILHEYLATKGKLTKQEVDQKVSKRQEWWMSGKKAVEFGFADGFIAGK